ncbi:hypothetical protein [Desulfuribacillus alkaliarsenatis]|uniref:FMN-binding domain-containing protein n=1 Tax=Desulfuribacillus alkaliarsenatis TaxID=766136 RepID=A0A1E5G4X6_9FIRM|nr:hypothetical protein [Desulfuribacillus alkaliarsenatis]OEF98169.1 hypothetical protein BHF68_00315 [Desulfuribacillus alkaliarsenatis]
MKKLSLLLMMMALVLALTLTGCDDVVDQDPVDEGEAPVVEEPAIEEPVEEAAKYDDGRYRGTYADRGVEQIGVQFDIADGVFTAVSFRELAYGGISYRSLPEDVDPLIAAWDTQYRQAIEYLVGKPLEAFKDLYNTSDFVEDIDGATGATIRGNKIASAIQDGLNRGLYSPANGFSTGLPDYDDGRYRGVYYDRGLEQVGVQFDIADGVFTAVSFRELQYGGTNYRSLPEDAPDVVRAWDAQYRQAIEYLVGKPVSAIFDLHNTGDFVDDIDGATGATIRGNKIFSAIKDGLNRGLYSPANGFSTELPELEDGRYRGIYTDRNVEQVGVQFDIADGVFTAVSFRELQYGGTNYRSLPQDAPDAVKAWDTQYRQAIEYLVGKPVSAIFDLHNTGDFVDDIDGATGATIRGNKIFSAIMDGINRGIYSY